MHRSPRRPTRFSTSAALLALVLGTASTALAGSARYSVRFESTWSRSTHPDSFPTNPHFSGLIGGTHARPGLFWEAGGIASEGIRRMAESGSKSPLRPEVVAAIDDGLAGAVISGGGIGRSPGSVSVSFEASDAFPLVTLVSMIAPSPDWFVGVDGLSMQDEAGRWQSEVVVDLLPWDAGTDSGTDYRSPNQATNPREPIALISGAPFTSGVGLGTFTFELIEVIGGEPRSFQRGEVETDGQLNLSDGVSILLFLFLRDTPPDCEKALDVNDSGGLDISDPTALLNFLFIGGPAPAAPFRECGPDPTDDALTCERFESCG